MNLQTADTGSDDFGAAFADFAKDDKSTDAPAQGVTDAGNDAGNVDAAPAATGTDGGAPGAGDAGGDSGTPAATDNTSAAPGAEAGGTTDAGAGTSAATEATPAVDPAPAAEAVPAAPSADEIVNRLTEVLKEQPKPAEAEPAATELPPLYSTDESAALEAYEKDWGDVSKAEDLKRRQFGRDLVQYIFDQIKPEIDRISNLSETVANRVHFSDLEKTVGPIDDNLKGQVDAWVAKQPGYLQATYNEVLSKGTVDEVTDLIGRFRKETGVAVPAAAAPSKGGSELSDTAKQAADSLAPVSTKRSTIETQDDPNDFGAAFAKFNEMFGKD